MFLESIENFLVGKSEPSKSSKPMNYEIELSPEKAFGLRKNQLRFFLLANALGYFGGIGCFLPVYDLSYFPFPYGPYGVLLLSFVSGYAILRYRFIDLQILLKKTIVFAALFAFIIGTSSFMLFIFQNILSSYINVNPFLISAISAAVIISAFDRFKKYLTNVTDRYLFQKKEDIKDILNQLSKNIITILDIEKLGSTILSTLKFTLRVEAGAIMIKDENGESYQLLDSFGAKSNRMDIKIKDPFIGYFTKTQEVVNLEDLEKKKALPADIVNRLGELGAVIAIPLFVAQDLIGVLFLGKRKSDQEFGQDEIDYFPTLAGQVAIALSNARAIDIQRKSQIDFAQQAKMASVGTLSSGISHEVKNPLNNIAGAVGMFRINLKNKVYDEMRPDQVMSEVTEVFEVVDSNVKRANLVIERLSAFAKKPKELNVKPMSLEKAIESALGFLEGEFQHHNIAIKKDFAKLPDVLADSHAMEDIFLNLLVNARHAMKDKGCIAISTKCENGEANVSIRDYGQGIPKENLERIFDPFFTTKDTTRGNDQKVVKGSGLGLFIVRETIRRFGGRINVESEVGSGTTFRIIFPVADSAKVATNK